MTAHNARAVRRRYGHYLWRVECGCGWRSRADDRLSAAALAKRHNTEKQATR